jgi:AP-1 complex subunit mu
MFSFLFKLVEVLTEYFTNVEEESIRDNFVVVYELLDEMMDNGYPQTTEFKILKEFIKTESFELKKDKKPETPNFNVVTTVSNLVSWRLDGIKYKKNEVFLDVIEKLNMLIGAQGNVIKSEIVGTVKVKCMLSGMPELKLGLNDKAFFEA